MDGGKHRVRMSLSLAMLALLTIGATPAPRAPQRIVSLNLCADQLLVVLADPGQIAALTVNARDPAMSAVAVTARRFATTRGGAEAVLALRPDLVIAAPYRARTVAALLDRRGTATLDLPPAESYTAIVAQIRQVARAIGHPGRGESLIRAMDAQLARLPRAPGGGRVAAYYQRRGFLTGTGTLVDELMRRAGLVNLAGRLGKPALARVSLEEMALARPDYLIVERETAHVTDQGSEMLHHPVLAGARRLTLPSAWTVCGGPAYVRAAESLAAQFGRERSRPAHQNRAFTPPITDRPGVAKLNTSS